MESFYPAAVATIALWKWAFMKEAGRPWRSWRGLYTARVRVLSAEDRADLAR